MYYEAMERSGTRTRVRGTLDGADGGVLNLRVEWSAIVRRMVRERRLQIR